MVELAQKSKITLTDFNPKRIASEPPETRFLALGVLIGRGVDIVKRQSPDKNETFTGLRGDFEAYFNSYTSSDGKIIAPDPWKSSVLFMDMTFLQPIIDIVSDKVDEETDKILERGAEAVNFAFDIGVQRAGNPQGYEWVLRALNDRPESERQTDKLAQMRKLLGNSKMPVIAALAPPPATPESSQEQHETAPAKGKK